MASLGTRALRKPVNAGLVNARVICRARSARKFMNTTTSPSRHDRGLAGGIDDGRRP